MKRLILFTITGVMFLISIATSGQEVVVSMTRMNQLYRSVNNPLRILIENCPAEKVVAKAKYGTLSPGDKPSEFWYYTEDCSIREEQIFVGLKTRNEIKWIDTSSYRVENALQPVLVVSGSKGGAILKDRLLASPGLFLVLDEFFIEGVSFSVDTFSVEAYLNDSIIYSEYNVPGNRFSSDLIKFIANEEPGYSLMLFVVRGSGPEANAGQDLNRLQS